MFDRSDLETLATFKGEHPIVSIYLELPPTLRGTPDAYRTSLKGLLKNVSDRASQEDIQAIEYYFDHECDWTGRSIVVFSGQADELWMVQHFAVPIRSRIHVGPKPFIMPLSNILDAYGSFAIALVDQQAVRMYYYHLGDLVATEMRAGEGVKRFKSGGGAQGRSRGDDLEGYHEEMVRGNLKDSADALTRFCTHYKAEHILLGGSETTLQHFKGMLKQTWQDDVVGFFSASFHTPEHDVREMALALMRARLHQRESDMVRAITARAAKGANGILGLEATREAAQTGRVQTLVMIEGALSSEPADTLIAQVVDFGGNVMFVEPESALSEADGVGALLRY